MSSPKPTGVDADLRTGARRGGRLSLRIGVAGLLLIALVTWFAYTKDIPFTQGYRMQGVFSSSTQLVRGSMVRIAGVDIGKVERIIDGPGTAQTVEMEIGEAGLPVHEDATLRVRPRLLLEGSYYVQLEPGSPSAPELPDGGVVPLSQTSTSVKADQIFGAFRRPTRESLRNTLAEVSTAFDDGAAEAFGRASRDLAPAFRDTALISQALLGSEPHDLSRFIAGSAATAAALAAHAGELGELVTNANRVTGALASESGALSASIREFDGLVREAPAALDAFDRSIPPLRRFTADLGPTLRNARPVLQPAAELLGQVDRFVRAPELPALLEAAKPTVKLLPGFEGRLEDLFALVGPVTECVGEKAIPVLEAVAPDGRLSTGRPIWQDLAHGLVGLASSAQTFDANGSFLRTIGMPEERTVSLGKLPGAGDVFANNSDPIIGTRPLWLGPGVDPPFRPDAPCAEQDTVDLGARTGAKYVGPSQRDLLDGAQDPPALDVDALRKDLERLPEQLGPARKGAR